MNETNKQNDSGFFGHVIRDDGMQRAAAGVVVAFLIAATKRFVFAKS